MSIDHDNSPRSTPPLSSALAHTADASMERMRALQNRPLPPEQLAANTELVAARAAVRSGATRSILVFRVGSELLALDAPHAHRVVGVSVIRRVPHRSNAVFAGLANILGELTLVADIGAALGIGSESTPTHFVVLGAVSERWAFAAASVEGVRRVDVSALRAPPTTVRHAMDGCVAHLIEVDSERTGAHGAVAAGSSTRQLITILDAAKLAARFQESLA